MAISVTDKELLAWRADPITGYVLEEIKTARDNGINMVTSESDETIVSAVRLARGMDMALEIIENLTTKEEE